METTTAPAEAPPTVRGLSLFRGDPFDRILTRFGLEGSVRRSAGLLLFAWGPMALAAVLDGHFIWRDAGGAIVPRQSFGLDFATWAQFWGFIPLATLGEAFVDRRMAESVPYLKVLTDPAGIDRLAERANRLARSRLAHLVCLVLGYTFSWLWARTEIANGLDSWHSVVAGPGGAWYGSFYGGTEWFTVAGLWVTFVALPLFTFMYLRWVWKITAWTLFLAGVSRRKLRILVLHPDRTGGLGSLSNVQSSFAVILFGTGLLVSAFLAYKLKWEGTSFESYTIWLPIVVYIVLAPSAFFVPLFMFTHHLRDAKHAAMLRFQPLALDVADAFQRGWLEESSGLIEEALRSEHSSNLADLHAAHAAVERMRVVPFDRRSALELFTAATLPFTPLLAVGELTENVRAILQIFG